MHLAFPAVKSDANVVTQSECTNAPLATQIPLLMQPRAGPSIAER